MQITNSWNFRPAICSGEKTSSELIYTGSCAVTAIVAITNGSNDATLIVYDNLSAAGKVIREFTIVAAENYGGNILKFPIYIQNGIYASISGTGASYIIDYIPLKNPNHIPEE